MKTIAVRRPHPTLLGVPTRPDRPISVVEMRRSLDRLVETFESNRIDTAATRGAIPGAAYDAGVRGAVHEALDDLETGRYGDCVACRAPIHVERLRRVPYARRCAPCQQIEERRWNQFERAMASVIRARVGEPQGRSTIRSPQGCGRRPHEARKDSRSC